MPSNVPPNATDFSNAAVDLNTIEDFANAAADVNTNGVISTRTGGDIKVLAKLEEEAQAAVNNLTNQYADIATVLADSTMTYSDVSAGDIITALKENVSWTVAASDATDYHVAIGASDVVRLYANVSLCGVITSSQLGFTDALNVTTAMNRFWSRFNAGETLLMQHFVTVSSLFAGNALPAQFKIKTQKAKVDGFNWTLDGSDTDFGDTGLFSVEADGAEFHGIKFETDNAGGVTGRYIRAPGTTNVKALKLHDCDFGMSSHASNTAGIDAPVYLQNMDCVEVLRNDFRGGKWLFTVAGVDHVEFAWNTCTDGTTDFGSSGGECIKTIQSDTWGVCEDWNVHHNYAHDLGRDFIDLTGGSSGWEVHKNHLKGINSGTGGIDVKTEHPSREDTWNPNRDMLIESNIFENASVVIKHNYGGTWLTSSVFNGTEAEVEALDIRGITLRNNTWKGNGKLTNEGGRNVIVDGDKFYDDTEPFDWFEDQNNAFGQYTPSCNGIIYKNIMLEYSASRNSPEAPAAKNVSLHFAHLLFKNGAAGSGIQVRSGAEDWSIAVDKLTHEGTSTTNRMAFYVNGEVRNIDFDIKQAVHNEGGSERPYLINVFAVDADSDGGTIDGDIRVKVGSARGFRGLVRVAQSHIERLTLQGSSALECTEGAVILSSGGNISDITNLYVLNNIGDGTIPEVSGSLNSGTVSEGTANGNVGFT